MRFAANTSAVAGQTAVVSASRPTFVMISAYNLYPPINDPLDPASVSLAEALSDIAQYQVSGIVYGTLGVSPNVNANFSHGFDPNIYNEALFKSAQDRGADIWLQLRYYDNWLTLGTGPTNLTAPVIIADPTAQAAFLEAAIAAVDVYEKAYPLTCTIILGEEETIYHSKTGGGLFWAGQTVWDNSPKTNVDGQYLAHSSYISSIFANRFIWLNRFLMSAIKQKYPNCRIAVHIGDEPLYEMVDNMPIYQYILQGLPPLGFTFYSLFEKISKEDADFERKLTDRVTLLKRLRQTVYYLAQLHTTDNFGSGAGRTPSASEIEATIQDASALGADGFGYYTKNSMPTICTQATITRGFWQDPDNPAVIVPTDKCNPREDLDPLDPNLEGGAPVYQNSSARWRFGLSKLTEFQLNLE